MQHPGIDEDSAPLGFVYFGLDGPFCQRLSMVIMMHSRRAVSHCPIPGLAGQANQMYKMKDGRIFPVSHKRAISPPLSCQS